MKRKATRRRVPIRQIAVTDELRRHIVRGLWPPGTQLPVRTALEQQFSVSPSTLQRVMDRLQSEGFVQTDSTVGTFVSPRPPHLFRFGLVYPYRPSPAGVWSRMWRQLEVFRPGVAKRHDIDIRPYFGRDTGRGCDTRDALIDDIEHRRLAGLVFTHPPDEYVDTPILTAPSIKRVAITVNPRADIPTVGFDLAHAIRLCCEHVRELGGTRLAMLYSSRLFSVNKNFARQWRTQVKANGLDCPDRWMIPVDLAEPGGARGLTELLFSGPRKAWPQVLFVQDDNFIKAVYAGLDHAGVSMPKDVKLICAVNQPRPAGLTRPAPVIVLDTQEVLHRCIEMVQHDQPTARRRSLVKPRLVTVA